MAILEFPENLKSYKGCNAKLFRASIYFFCFLSSRFGPNSTVKAKKVEKVAATRISLAPPGVGHFLSKMRNFVNKRNFFLVKISLEVLVNLSYIHKFFHEEKEFVFANFVFHVFLP